jgi:primosomal protein N' (replication factor Y)
LIAVSVAGGDENAVLAGSAVLKASLIGYLRGMDAKVLGPAPEAVAKVNNRYRYRLLVSCVNTKGIRDAVAHTVKEFARDGRHRGVAAFADASPYD